MFIEQQQMTVTVFCICIFVQCDFIFQVASLIYWILYLIFFAGALGQTPQISLWINTVCTEENIFKSCFIRIFDIFGVLFNLHWYAIQNGFMSILV